MLEAWTPCRKGGTVMRSRTRSVSIALTSILCLVVLGCQTMRAGAARPPATGAVPATPASIEEARAQVLRKDRAQRAAWANKTFEEFERSVYKEPFPDGKYIVNGDIAIADRKQLREFFETSIARSRPRHGLGI